jgi:hypothetical protein
MKLMTQELKKAFEQHPLYSNEELPDAMDAQVVVKYFGGSAATWLITEGEEQANGDWLFFGFCTLGLPDPFDDGKLLWEWGYVTLKQLEEVRFPPFELPVERDLYLPENVKVRDEVFMYGE